MSKINLKLDGVDIPLPSETEIAITYKANDVRNIGNRDGSYAETFTLPDNNIVRRALGNSQFVTSATQTPYRLLPASIEIEGNAVLSGTAAHNEVNEGFAVDVDGQNADLFVLVKGRNLSDIDLADLDHTFDNNTVGTSNSHNPARGFLYPLINYGRFTNRELKTGNIRFDEMRPAVYVKTLLERMAAPYTLTGSILFDEKFKKLTVPFTNSVFQYRESYRAQFDAKASSNVPVEYTGGGFNPYPVEFHQANNDPSGSLNSEYQYVAPIDGNYDVTINLKLSTDLVTNEVTGTTDILLLELPTTGGFNYISKVSVGHGQNQSVSLSQSVLNLKAGSKLGVFFDPAFASSDNYILAGATFHVALQNVVHPGNPVHLEVNLPDVTQEDLLLAVCNMFNLLIQTDPVRKVYRLDSLEQLKHQSPVDWSKKIDWLQKPRFTFALENYGQTSLLSYGENEATDFTGNPITDAMVFTVDNEQLEPEKELFTSAFTFTQNRPAFKGLMVMPYIPLFAQQVKDYSIWNPDKIYLPGEWVLAGSESFAGPENWVCLLSNSNSYPTHSNPNWEIADGTNMFEGLEANPRLLLVETRPDYVPVGEDYEPATTYPLYTYGSFTGLESETLQSQYHTVTQMMLEQTRVMGLSIRLRLPDINALDFLKPVMLNLPEKNLQGMFYLNAVNMFRPDKYLSTEVELVRLFRMPLISYATGHLEFSEEFSSEFN